MRIAVSADSTCDLSPELIRQYDLRISPLYITMGTESRRDGVDCRAEDLFSYTEKTGRLALTAAVTVADYLALFAEELKESDAVIHAIEAHHGDVEPHTVEACLVQAADAISASRPGARRENIENYVKRLEKLEEVSKSFPGISSSYAIQAGREIRIMVKPEEVSEDQMVLLARDIAKKIEEELTYPGQIKVHVLRETKAVDYAK